LDGFYPVLLNSKVETNNHITTYLLVTNEKRRNNIRLNDDPLYNRDTFNVSLMG